MSPAERTKAINKAKNSANTRLRQKYRQEWREIYVEEATALGLSVTERYPPSIRISELEEEVQQLTEYIKKLEGEQ